MKLSLITGIVTCGVAAFFYFNTPKTENKTETDFKSPPQIDAPLYETSDIQKGEYAFKRLCSSCHHASPDAKGRMLGPNLWKVYNRTIASQDYKYSNVLRSYGNLKWDKNNLNQYLYQTRRFAPRGYMSFRGVRNHQMRRDIIEYLTTLSD